MMSSYYSLGLLFYFALFVHADLPLDISCVNDHYCPAYSGPDVVKSFLSGYDCHGSEVYCNMVVAQMEYYMNESNETKEALVRAQATKAAWDISSAKAAMALRETQNITGDWKRQIDKISIFLNISAEQEKERNEVITRMTSIFGSGAVCEYVNGTPGDCSDYSRHSKHFWTLDPTLDQVLAKSRDYDELQYVFEQWRRDTGAQMRQDYKEYVAISNEAAANSGFNDLGEFWRVGRLGNYGQDFDFKGAVKTLWEQVLPLYEELHAYIRRKLRNVYTNHDDEFNATIPAHLLGNMWAQQWNNILDLTIPFPNSTKVDVTPEMIRQGYDPMKMFEVAKDFYTSIGLDGYNDRFFADSLVEKTGFNESRTVECYADSETYYNDKDYGMSICTKVTMEDLITIHHELGHINYFMQYSKQPLIYQDGANSGFHEAIGDTMALSATTIDHLDKIGLLNSSSSDNETEETLFIESSINSEMPSNVTEQDINFLFNMALEKIAFLPFGYLIDQYRWKIFEGDIAESDYQKEWWKLRFKYQGIRPPGGSEWENDESLFDPGAKFHVANDVPYVRYFVSFIIQFQFHKALCDAAGGPPGGLYHRCDIYQSKKAGAKLKDLLKLGSSVPWQDAMEQFTGGRDMDASVLVQYFDPLLKFLREENDKNDECFGWGYDWGPLPHLRTRRCEADGSVTDVPEWTSTPSASSEVVSTVTSEVPTTPKRVPVGTKITFDGSFTDMTEMWQDAFLDPKTDEYIALAEKYMDNLTSIFDKLQGFNTTIDIDGFSQANEEQMFLVLLKERSANTPSALVVSFCAHCKSTEDDEPLPSVSDVTTFFAAQAKAEGLSFNDIQVKVKEDATTTPAGMKTDTPAVTSSTAAPGSPVGDPKYQKLAIAGLTLSCIVIVVVFGLIVYLVIYRKEGGRGRGKTGNSYSTLDEPQEYEVSHYRPTAGSP